MRAVIVMHAVMLAGFLSPAIAAAEISPGEQEEGAGARRPGCMAGVVAEPARPEALPRDPKVREAWSAVAAHAPCAAYWFGQWPFSAPKEEVAGALATSLKTLQGAASAQESPELLLALGLAGRYGHNIDLEGMAEIGLDALRLGMKRRPADPRFEWTLGGSLCHAAHLVEGWTHLAHVLETSKGRPLPAAFWRDYQFCANGAAMPAHALRAAAELEKLGAANRFDRSVAATVREWQGTTPASLAFETGAGWTKTKSQGGRAVLTSLVLGIRFSLADDAPIPLGPLKDGVAGAKGYLASSQGRRTQVHPGISVLVQAGRDETLAELAAREVPTAHPASGDHDYGCPADRCVVLEGRFPGAYDKTGEGDGLIVVVAFERDEPAFPGLLFEEPRADQVAQLLPGEGGADNPSGLAVKPIWHSPRLGGKLKYLVMLDTAESVAPAARKAFIAFLKELVVE